jgi:multidrug efflux pump
VNISAPFIRRPVATTLLMVALGLAGAVAFELLPVSPLPQVDFPTISVSASLPGASPETMASSVATPLERQFGRIAAVTEMTSSSSLGSTTITLQFDLDRDIDAAARDVQAAINAARGYLPANLPSNPNYRKVNPADSPIMILSLTSSSLSKGQIYDAASTVLAQKIAQIDGVLFSIIIDLEIGLAALPAEDVRAFARIQFCFQDVEILISRDHLIVNMDAGLVFKLLPQGLLCVEDPTLACQIGQGDLILCMSGQEAQPRNRHH